MPNQNQNQNSPTSAKSGVGTPAPAFHTSGSRDAGKSQNTQPAQPVDVSVQNHPTSAFGGVGTPAPAFHTSGSRDAGKSQISTTSIQANQNQSPISNQAVASDQNTSNQNQSVSSAQNPAQSPIAQNQTIANQQPLPDFAKNRAEEASTSQVKSEDISKDIKKDKKTMEAIKNLPIADQVIDDEDENRQTGFASSQNNSTSTDQRLAGDDMFSKTFTRAYSEYFRDEVERATQRKASGHNLPYINLIGYNIASSTISIIPENIAKKYQAVSFLKSGDELKVALINPDDQELIKYLTELANGMGLKLGIVVASGQSLKYALKNYEHVGKIAQNLNMEITKDQSKEMAVKVKSLNDLKNTLVKIPTTYLFEIIVSGALQNRASDIHIEPKKDGMTLRYRIDGILQNITELKTPAYKSLISRIKYLAGMKLDLTDQAQDGRFTVSVENVPIDLRVSTLPTVWGENIVARLLSHDTGFLTLKNLMFSEHIQKAVEKAIKKPTGIILNTGPTGSGKTTTLYAILDELNKPGIKIVTLEDPVEYRISGITQTQINADAGLDFANALKHSLRQDPDIILVGEIRDSETASTAVDAGLTGHLVLSTLHTNNAASALTRLIDLGVKPFLLPGVIRLIIAQRLVRELCDKCKQSYKPSSELVEEIKTKIEKFKDHFEKVNKEFVLYKPVGCEACNSTGFIGRIPIAECITPSVEIEEIVIAKKPTSKITEQALKEGMIPMEIDGLVKALDGLTTVEEIWRVTRD